MVHSFATSSPRTSSTIQISHTSVNFRLIADRYEYRVHMADHFQLLGGIAVVLFALYYYFTATFDFWKNRGVPGPRPIPVFGNTKDVLFRRTHIGNYVRKLYNEYRNKPFIGIFFNRQPALVVCDLDLIKDVFIKDFSAFDDRGHTMHPKVRR